MKITQEEKVLSNINRRLRDSVDSFNCRMVSCETVEDKIKLCEHYMERIALIGSTTGRSGSNTSCYLEINLQCENLKKEL